MQPEDTTQNNQPESTPDPTPQNVPNSQPTVISPDAQQPNVVVPTEPSSVPMSSATDQQSTVISPENQQPAMVSPVDPVVPTAQIMDPQAGVPPVGATPEINNPTPLNPAQTTTSPMSSADIAKKSKGKGLMKFGIVPLVAIVVLLLAAGSAGAYFGVILPNNPENLWKTSLKRTGIGLDKYLQYTNSMQDSKGSKIKGNFNVDASGTVIDGNFEGKTYENDANVKADIGAAGSRVDLELMMHTPETAKNPDIYMRVKGLDGLSSVLGVADPSTSKLLAKVNNQWYVVDHTLLDQITASSASNSTGLSSFSDKDIAAIEAAVVTTTKQHLLATSPDKAVLVVKKNVGSEELDGRKVYHYKVGLNKNNTKEYLMALKDELKKTKIGEVYKDQGIEKEIGFDDLLKEVDKMPDDSNVDVWVDKSTKLIRSVKISPRDHPEEYVQFSLNYNGGKTYSFVFKLHGEKDGKSDASIKIDQDTSKKSTAMDFTIATEETSGSKAKLSGKLAVEPSDEKIEFTKPSDVKSVYELLGGLMGGYSTLGDSTDIPSVLGNFDL